MNVGKLSNINKINCFRLIFCGIYIIVAAEIFDERLIKTLNN